MLKVLPALLFDPVVLLLQGAAVGGREGMIVPRLMMIVLDRRVVRGAG
jgi:hypothetical protein